jgi:hypothetical protein
MGKKVASRCLVEVDGESVEYFKSFTEDAREIRRQVKLMNGHATMDVNPDHMFRINYIIPKTNPKNWDDVEDVVFTVIIPGTKRITFSPASVLTVGVYTMDNENEAVQPIIFGYEDRTES